MDVLGIRVELKLDDNCQDINILVAQPANKDGLSNVFGLVFWQIVLDEFVEYMKNMDISLEKGFDILYFGINS